MASNGWKYDVFVSFIEENSCNISFSQQLFSALDQKGITHFRSSPSSTTPEVLEAIQASRLSVIVFSKTFPSSSRCLDELVKIAECIEVKGQIAFPVFYDVKPSVVRNHEGSYGEFLEEYAKSLVGQAEKWREALTELANLYGWVLQDRRESELIQEIATLLLNKLNDSSPPSSSTGRKLDVYISFKEGDSSRNFVDHVSNALEIKGITHSRDHDKILERGKPISSGILDAIKRARFSIIVFSRNYAASPWCLDELVSIVECMNVGHEILPIFYDVEPAEVRNHKESYGRAFKEHEEVYREERVKKWKSALTDVANLAGWALPHKSELLIIQEVIGLIFSKLNDSFCDFSKDVVGIESRLQNMDSYLDMGSYDVRFIGIFGMGGIGKTTLAYAIYKNISHNFDSCSFLMDIRDVSKKRGVEALQELALRQLLKDKSIDVYDTYKGTDLMSRRLRGRRILLILDDVDNLEQLEALAGELQWFGPGSRIIITTRNKDLLRAHEVELNYDMKALNYDESLLLFGNRAFKQNYPTEEYINVAKLVIWYTSGLPLALKVLGSFLHGRSINVWEKALTRLQRTSNQDILDVLQISFDALEESEKNIFLDITCFYHGKKKERLTEILDCYDFDPVIGISILIDRCLIIEQHGNIVMHSLLRDMGWAIVRRECPVEQGKRSRLWISDDIYHVLSRKTGTEVVEGISLNYLEAKVKCLDKDVFSKMDNLRLLKIQDAQLPKKLVFLPNTLRILKWRGYPLTSLPWSFSPKNLVELNMSHSFIEQLPRGMLHLEKLKVMKLSHSKRLTKIPNFRGFPILEKLILEGCVSLCELHPTIGELKNLILLNLTDCSNLPSLPNSICGIKHLKTLCLLGCTKLDMLPENLGDIKYLEELDVGRTAIQQAPSSILRLTSLKKLSFQGCKGQPQKLLNVLFGCLLPGYGPKSLGFTLPSSLSGLLSLNELNLSDCNLFDGSIPSDLVRISSLKKLNLSRNHFMTLPTGIIHLSQLQTLELESCKKLGDLSKLPSSIEELRTFNCCLLKTLSTPSDLSVAKRRDFMLTNCFELVKNDEEHVTLKILKTHLFSLMRSRLLSLFFNFLKWTEFQGGDNQGVRMLTDYIKKVMEVLYKEINCAEPNIPDLIIFVSGTDIPDWFIHQPPVPSVTITLDPGWSSNGMLLGLAVCGLFEVRDENSIECTGFSPPGVRQLLPAGHSYKFSFNLLSDKRGHVITSKYLTFKREDLAVSDHMWMFYLPFDDYMHKNNWEYIETHFKCEGPGIAFKKCGIRMVFMSDVVELNQEMYGDMDISDFQNLANILAKFVTSDVHLMLHYSPNIEGNEVNELPLYSPRNDGVSFVDEIDETVRLLNERLAELHTERLANGEEIAAHRLYMDSLPGVKRGRERLSQSSSQRYSTPGSSSSSSSRMSDRERADRAEARLKELEEKTERIEEEIQNWKVARRLNDPEGSSPPDTPTL